MADELHESSDPARLITLFANGDQVFVWNADEAFMLRSKYRIVGSLVGSLPRKPKQNLCFSLPLVLMREEVKLLLEKRLARIIDSSEIVWKPSAEEVEKFNTLRELSVKQQLNLFRKEREKKENELSDLIEAGRKRKRRRDENTGHLTQAKLPNLMKDSREHDRINEVEDINDSNKNKPRVLKAFCSDAKLRDCRKEEETQPCMQDEGTEAVTSVEDGDVVKRSCSVTGKGSTIFADEKTENRGEGAAIASPEVEKEGAETFDEGAPAVLYHIPSTLPPESIPHKVMDWTYPDSEQDKLHYKAFLDLWEKGYYITSGAKFGGDYLVYPGDPLRFHSFYIVVVLPRQKKVTPFDIISLGRLGSTVKKTAVFCSVNEDSQVTYTSVKWTNIS